MTAPILLPLPDSEFCIRSWARSLDLANASKRIFFGMPDNPIFPLVVQHRVGGPVDLDIDSDYPTMSFDVWSKKGKRECDLIAMRLVHALRTLGPTVVQSGGDLSTGGVLMGASRVDGPRPMPDPDASLYRNVVSAQITLRPLGS